MKWVLIAVWLFSPDTTVTMRSEFKDINSCTDVSNAWVDEAASLGIDMHAICLPDRGAK